MAADGPVLCRQGSSSRTSSPAATRALARAASSTQLNLQAAHDSWWSWNAVLCETLTKVDIKKMRPRIRAVVQGAQMQAASCHPAVLTTGCQIRHALTAACTGGRVMLVSST